MLTRAKPIRVLLVDLRPVVGRRLERLLDGESPPIGIVGYAHNYTLALELAAQLLPDVILLRVFQDGMDPWHVIRQLTHRCTSKVLILKGMYESVSIRKVTDSGAYGVVLSEGRPELIAEAIVEAQGNLTVPDGGERRSGYLARGHMRLGANPEYARLAQLTLREKEVIRAIAAAPTAKYLSIADQLGISEHTVHNHLSKIYQKLDLTNRIDLLIYSSRHGLAESGEPAMQALTERYRNGPAGRRLPAQRADHNNDVRESR